MGRVVLTGRKGTIHQVRRAWSLVHGKERRRLQLVAAYGILIAGLDTIALILLFAMISLLDNQPATGITQVVLPERSAEQRSALPRSTDPADGDGGAVRAPERPLDPRAVAHGRRHERGPGGSRFAAARRLRARATPHAVGTQLVGDPADDRHVRRPGGQRRRSAARSRSSRTSPYRSPFCSGSYSRALSSRSPSPCTSPRSPSSGFEEFVAGSCAGASGFRSFRRSSSAWSCRASRPPRSSSFEAGRSSTPRKRSSVRDRSTQPRAASPSSTEACATCSRRRSSSARC